MADTLKTIPVEELKLGMYVSKLDISWIKVPFFRQRRMIASLNDIKLLTGAGVKFATIDLDKSDLEKYLNAEPPNEETNTVSDHTTAIHPETNTSSRTYQPDERVAADRSTPTSRKEPSSIKDELRVAEEIEKEAFSKISAIHEKILEGSQVEIEEISPVIEKTLASLERNKKALLALLSKRTEENDKLIQHHFRVLTLVMTIGIRLGYSERQLEELATAALLHDAAWVKLPNQLLTKRKPYNTTEQTLVERHVTGFDRVFSSIPALNDDMMQIITEHHERGDGSGYPNQLKLDEICEPAQLLAVCDHFDELNHGLGEHAGMLPKNALSLIYKEAEVGRFNAKIVSELIYTMGIYPLGSAVQLQSNEKALVIDINEEEPLLPTIRLVYDELGQPLVHKPEINLAEPTDNGTKKSIKKIIDPSQSGVDPAGILVWSNH